MPLPPSPQEFFVAGGTLWSEAPSYITRPVDDELLQLTLAGEYCNVLAARQMGKSSLMVRTARQLQGAGVRTAIIDISTLGGGISTPGEWFFGFLDELTVQLDLDVDFPAWWESHAAQNAVQRFSNFLRDIVLTEIQTPDGTPSPITIFIDEIDSALGMAFTDDFFAAIRGAYNARATHPAFQRLTFVLVGVARPADLIRDRNRTPYNIGTPINLRDFILPELHPFQEVFDKAYPTQGADILQWILAWTNGQPYLTQKLCAALVNDSATQRFSDSANQQTNERTNQPTNQLITQSSISQTVHRLFFTDEARKESNLRAIRDRIESSPYKIQMIEIYARILRGKPVPDEERNPAKNELKLTGLVRPTPSGTLEIRNRIYRQVFDAAWVQKNLPRTRSPQVVLTSLIAIVAVFIAAFALYQQRLQSTRTFEDQFTASNSPDVKLTSLARLLELDDPTAAQTALTLYAALPHTGQLALFTDLSDPQNVADDLVPVIRAVYQNTPNTPDGNEILSAMKNALGEIGAPGAPSLKTEIEFWLKGRDEYARENYPTALSFLDSAWTESQTRNQPNLSVRFDRALTLIALENYAPALEDLQSLWEQTPARQDEIAALINAHPAFTVFSQTQLPSTADLLSYLTPVPPSATPTSTSSPTPSQTPTLTFSPTPTLPATYPPTIQPTSLPALSPYNGWIAYALGDSTQREIYLLNPRTRSPQQITSNPVIDESPSFSPDNWKIVYSSNRSQGGWQLYAYDLQRNTEQQLTSFIGQARFPAWSPVPGDIRVLFEGHEFQPTAQTNIWLLDIATGMVEQLTFSGTDFRPTWSPDGQKILFGRATADSDHNGFVNVSDNGDLFTLDLATGEENRLTNTPDYDDFNFDWSPDGQWIVFASVRGDATGDGVQNLDDSQDLFRIRADGTGEVRLNLGGVRTFSPSWSPDGRFILYLVLGENHQNQIWRYDTQNGNILALTDPGLYYQPVYSAPNPAPTIPVTLTDYDLAFASDRDGDFGVYVMDTGDPTRWQLLPRPTGFERAWWPTFCGNLIADETVDTDGLQPQWIYLQTADNPTPIKYPTTLNAGRFGVPRCSPDGERLAFSTYIPTLFEGWILGLNDFASGVEVALPEVASFGYVSWSNLDNFYLSMTIQDGDFYVLETANYQTSPTYTTLAKGKFPALSPTGIQYIYLCSDQSYLCLQNVAGGETKLVQAVVSVSIAGESMPATAMWSGDGLWIYFASAPDGDWDIYRVRPDGSELQNLTADWPTNEIMPALKWNP